MSRRLIPRQHNCAFHPEGLPPGPHAVLPHVSMGYTPPRDRSPTCYSPVRHSPQPLAGSVPVRLACLIRAASVRSEPGSNSQVMILSNDADRSRSRVRITHLTRFDRTSVPSQARRPTEHLSVMQKGTLASDSLLDCLTSRSRETMASEPPPTFPFLQSQCQRARLVQKNRFFSVVSSAAPRSSASARGRFIGGALRAVKR